LRFVQAEVVAEGFAGVGGAEEVAALEFGGDEGDEVVA
jgi:hypothetical protein